MPDRVWLVRVAGLCAALAFLAFCTPLLWAAVSAGLGILALIGMIATAVLALQTMPLAFQKLENRILQARKNEARANPIEQLQNDCLRREERLEAFRRALVQIGGKIESMRQMLEDRRDIDPDQVLDHQERALERMNQFYRANIQRLTDAHAALDAFRHKIKQKEFEWEFVQAGKVVMGALNPAAMEDLMQGLLTDEALRSVQDHFNAVFAELDVGMRSVDAPTRQHLSEQHLDPLEALTISESIKPRRVR
jgi:hypothetical protein